MFHWSSLSILRVQAKIDIYDNIAVNWTNLECKQNEADTQVHSVCQELKSNWEEFIQICDITLDWGSPAMHLAAVGSKSSPLDFILNQIWSAGALDAKSTEADQQGLQSLSNQ